MRIRAQPGPGSDAEKPARSRRQLGGWGALLLALAVIGGSAWWLSFRHRSAEMAAEVTALEPQERALREAVAKAPADLEASRALGRYLFGRVRPYEAMWAFQDALELRPDD